MILHVEIDAFYASVEERDQPDLVGQPVIVGGSAAAGGLVAAANYAARRFGVYNAMPTATAMQLCPQAVLLPRRIGYYGEISQQIRAILERFTPLVEPLSLDEAFLDVADSERMFGTAAEIGLKIKQAIRKEVELTASVGAASNKFLARIASYLEKPDGFVVVLPVARLWGVGRHNNQTLASLGIATISQLRRLQRDVLLSRFHTGSELLWRLARGLDDRPVVPERETKSISHETTFEEDIEETAILRSWLLELTEQISWRLRRHRVRARTLCVKVQFTDFVMLNCSETLAEPTNISKQLWQVADQMLKSRLPQPAGPVRLLGVGASDLDGPGLVNLLFAQTERQEQADLDAEKQRVKQRWGVGTVRKASKVQCEMKDLKRRGRRRS
ncbi:MAG: DNA polymerase IV [Thermoguttaceae bacterium]